MRLSLCRPCGEIVKFHVHERGDETSRIAEFIFALQFGIAFQNGDVDPHADDVDAAQVRQLHEVGVFRFAVDDQIDCRGDIRRDMRRRGEVVARSAGDQAEADAVELF